MVFEELFTIELNNRVLRADRPRVGHEAWHAGPRNELSMLLTQCSAALKRVSRLRKTTQPSSAAGSAHAAVRRLTCARPQPARPGTRPPFHPRRETGTARPRE